MVITKRLNLFVKNLVNQIKNDAITVILFGSLADNTWVKGTSDIDLFIICKNKRKKELLKRLFYWFMKLEKKYNANLSGVCFGRGQNILVKAFIRFEYYFLLNVPYYVIEENEINLNGFALRDRKARFLSMFGSLKIFGLELKRNGIVIYGKKLLSKIKISPINQIDRLKFLFSLFIIFLLGLLILPVDLQIGKRHLNKVLKRYKMITR